MKTLLGFRIVPALLLLVAFSFQSYGQSPPIVVINYTNQSWRYNDTTTTGSNPEGLFQAPSFDDTVAGWKTGFALFGNDDAGVYNYAGSPFVGLGVNGFTTPLDRTGGRVTFYFRTHFNFSSDPAFVTLYTTNYLDDSMIVYINGQEAGRMRITASPPTWDSLGSNPPTEGIPYFLELSSANMVQGDNVMAVELHQSSSGSSDAAFAMKMIAILPFAPKILDSTQPSNRVVLAHRATALTVVADGAPSPTYQWFKDGGPITDATNATFTIPDMGSADAGDYFARVTNPLGTIDSRTAQVRYSTDGDPPLAVRAAGGVNFDKILVFYNEAVKTDPAQDGFNYEISDELGNSYSASGGVISADGTYVTLALDPNNPLAENTLVTVHIENVQDLSDNVIAPGTMVQFRSNVRGCGGLVFEAFRPESTTDNSINNTLLLDPNFPNFPQERLTMPAFDTRTVYPNDGDHEGYGARIRGEFIPVVSGNWVFYLGSDDSSRLWLNPTGPGATGKILLTEETGCCADWIAHVSAPQALVGGQPYYIEGVYKEGTGGDYMKVSARLQAEGRPPDNPNGQQSVSLYAIPGDMLGYPSAPGGILAGTTISSQPANQTVIAGNAATFSVQLSPDVPGCFQWRKNGTDIPGATGQYYRFTTAQGDDNTRYSVVVSLMGGTVLTSSEATLRVGTDTTPPTVLSATTDANATNILVTFSEPVDATSAGTTGNYTITGYTIQQAIVSGATVNLRVSPALATCVRHSLVIQNVKDVNNNPLSPNPTTVIVIAPIVVLNWDAATTWRYDDTGNTSLPANWTAPAYNDSAWKSGASVFAFEPATYVGDAPVRTVMLATSATNTTYFRTHFNLPTGPSTVTALRLLQIVDDGAVYYLNGTELYRSRISPGPVTPSTIANAGGPEPTDGTHPTEGPFDLPLSALQEGDNLLAVEVHPSSTTSSDAVFGATLTAIVTDCRPDVKLTIVRLPPCIDCETEPVKVKISWTGTGTLYGSPTISPANWALVGSTSPVIVQATGNRFFRFCVNCR